MAQLPHAISITTEATQSQSAAAKKNRALFIRPIWDKNVSMRSSKSSFFWSVEMPGDL